MSALSGTINPPASCEHDWKPISFVYETQLLDSQGRVLIRQPDLDEARVYLVCLECASHTYLTTSWVGFRLYGSEDANPRYISPEGEVHHIPNPDFRSGYNRAGFNASEKETE